MSGDEGGARYGGGADPAVGIGCPRACRERPLRAGPAPPAARQRELLRRHRPGRPLVRRPRPRPQRERRRHAYGRRRAPADQGVRVPGSGGTRRGDRLPHHRGPAPAVLRRRLPHRALRGRRRRQDHHQPAPLRHRPAGPDGRGADGLLPPLVALLAAADPQLLVGRRVRRRADHRRRPPLARPLHGPRRPPGGPAAPASRRHLAGLQPLSGGRPHRRQPLPRLGRAGPAAGRGGRRRHPLLRPPLRGRGPPLHVGHAYDFIRWAERYGYDLAYADARDLHAGRVDPSRYRGLVFPGHDEYWSIPMRRTAERARTSAPRSSSSRPTPCTGRSASARPLRRPRPPAHLPQAPRTGKARPVA